MAQFIKPIIEYSKEWQELTEIVVRMSQTGLNIDKKRLKELQEWLTSELEVKESYFRQLSGVPDELNIGSDFDEKLAKHGYITVSEPASGSGSMLIAFSESMPYFSMASATFTAGRVPSSASPLSAATTILTALTSKWRRNSTRVSLRPNPSVPSTI